MSPEFADVSFLERYRGPIVQEMRAAFAAATVREPHLPLYEMIRYHLGWSDEGGDGRGGKLLRPSLLLLCCAAAGGSVDVALPAAAAVEFVHNFTLIHDDIEDRGELRHGRQAVWRRWGTPLAVNAGDALWATARLASYRLLDAGVAADTALAAMRALDEACASVCEGQDRDLRFEGDTTVGVDEYLQMVRGKTGALMAAAATIGALLAGAKPSVVAAFREFGLRAGIAFQIRDDALGMWGDAERTGKAPGEDLRERKLTYPIVHALEHAAGDDRAALAKLRAGPMSDHGVQDALAILDRAAAREATDTLAAEAAEAAVEVIRAQALVAVQRDELIALARFAASRPR